LSLNRLKIISTFFLAGAYKIPILVKKSMLFEETSFEHSYYSVRKKDNRDTNEHCNSVIDALAKVEETVMRILNLICIMLSGPLIEKYLSIA